MIKYSLIAGVAENLVIGNKNSIPWYLPEDLMLFRKLTTDNILIMGRKTFESIGKPLPNRISIVITKNVANFKEEYLKPAMSPQTKLFCTSNIEEAFLKATKIKNEQSEKEIFITGGASIYRHTIEGAKKLYISRIPLSPEGDTFFPEFRNGKWMLEKTELFANFRLEIYHRK